jgi:hypothetical protein
MTDKKLSVLVIGDPHFKVDNPRESEEMMMKSVQLAKDRKVDRILILGDIFDRFESVHVKTMVRGTTFLKQLSKIAHVTGLIGNHDRANNSVFLTTDHFFNAFKEWQNVTIVDEGEIVKFDGYTFIMVPYVPVGRFDEALDIILNRYGYVMTPEMIESMNAEYSAELTSIPSLDQNQNQSQDQAKEKEKEQGLSIDIEFPSDDFLSSVQPIYNNDIQLVIDSNKQEIKNKLDDINGKKVFLAKTIDYRLKQLKCNGVFAHQEFFNVPMGRVNSTVGDRWNESRPFVISGHIHTYIRLKSNIVYTGTPMQQAFDETDDKTVSIFTWDSPETMFPTEERIDLELTKKQQIRLSWDQISSYVPPSNIQIKIIIVGTSAEIKSATETANYKKLLKQGIKIVTSVVNEFKCNKQFQYDGTTFIQKLFQQVLSVGDNNLNVAWNEIFCAGQ